MCEMEERLRHDFQMSDFVVVSFTEMEETEKGKVLGAGIKSSI